MMTREELYGMSITIDFPGEGSTVQLPPFFDIRLLICGDQELTVLPITLRLPDPQTIRQHGWLVFAIYNASGVDLNIETATGALIGFLNPILPAQLAEIGLLGLISAEFPLGGGSWAFVKKETRLALGNRITESVCFGSTTGLGDDVDSYQFALDSWLAYDPLPIVSGSGIDISAGSFVVTFADIEVYYGQFAEFYEWSPPGTTTLQSTSNYKFAQTGLGVIQGSAIGDLMHIANANEEVLNAYKMEVFGVAGDVWTIGLTFPSFTGITAPEVTVCQSIGIEEANQFTFTSASTADTSSVFIAYDKIAQIYLVAAYPPWPWGPYRPSCVGIGSRLHFQGGSYSEILGVADSTDAHYEFNPFLGTWQTLPPLPVIGRGLGILGFQEPRDRYTFGMGETTSVPSEVHFEYNTITRTYRARGTFNWGATGRTQRESAWGTFFQ